MSDKIEEYIDRVKDELAYLDEPKPAGAPRYSSEAITITYLNTCLDCGAAINDKRAHDRFHAILNDHAAALAILQTVHLNERLHDRFDVTERIKRRRDRAAATTSDSEVVE